MGEIEALLGRKGLNRNTMIIFTSDNGPWYEGSPGYTAEARARATKAVSASPLSPSGRAGYPRAVPVTCRL